MNQGTLTSLDCDPLAALLSLITAIASFGVLWVTVGQIAIWAGPVRLFWRALSALSVGIGLWASLYLGLLAVRWPAPFTLSLVHQALLFIIAAATAFAATRPAERQSGHPWEPLGSGLALSLLILWANAVALDSIQLTGESHYNPFAALPLSALLGMTLVAGLRRLNPILRHPPHWESAAIPILLGGAYALVQQIGLATAHISPSLSHTGLDRSPDYGLTVWPIALGSLITLALTALMGQMERRNMLFTATVAENSPDGLITMSRREELIYFNRRAGSLIGRPLPEIAGQQAWEAFPPDLTAVLRPEVQEQVERPGAGTREIYYPTMDRWYEVVVHPWPDYLAIVLRDVTSRRRLEEQIRHQATHDQLTGLANRRLFREELEQALARPNPDAPDAVLFLDLDDFKQVNDTWGHLVGDELLVGVAERLCACIRRADRVARLGGDEFAILLPAVGAEGAAQVAERIHEAMDRSFTVGQQPIGVQTSIGIALATPSATVEDLLRFADMAMYRAKAGGKGRFVFYQEERSLPG